MTEHAEEEREDDQLTVANLREIVLTDDLRGDRYVVRGKAQDGREVEIACRFLASGKLRIITVYVLEEK